MIIHTITTVLRRKTITADSLVISFEPLFYTILKLRDFRRVGKMLKAFYKQIHEYDVLM